MSDLHRERHEYETMRAAEEAARRTLARERDDARPDQAVLRSLHGAMRARTSASWRGRIAALVASIFGARIPTYQAALGVAVVALLLLAIRPGGDAPRTIVERQIVEVPVRDTVVITRDATAVEPTKIIDTAERRRRRPGASARPMRRDDDRPRASLAASTQRRGDKDSAIAKPDVERPNRIQRGGMLEQPNRFVGLDNVPLIAQQRRGVSIAEDSAYRRFTFAVN